MLDGSEPSAELADLLHVRVILLGRRGDDKGLSTAVKDLATLAEQLGSRRVLAEAYLAQIRSFSDDRDVVITRELAQHALNEAEAANEPLLVQRAHDILALFAYTLGEHRVARHHATLSLAVARQLGAPTLEVYPRNRLVSVDLMAGKWEEALRESVELVARLAASDLLEASLVHSACRALVHVYRGDLDEAAACLAEAHEIFGGGTMFDHNIFRQVAHRRNDAGPRASRCGWCSGRCEQAGPDAYADRFSTPGTGTARRGPGHGWQARTCTDHRTGFHGASSTR